MRIEEKREFDTSPKQIWDFAMDMSNLPMWYSGIIESFEPDTGTFEKEGDSVRFVYRVLGRRLEMTMTIEEVKEYELLRDVVDMGAAGLPRMHQVWRHTELAGDRDLMEVTYESEEPTSFFGTVIEKTLLPRLWRRDLVRSLESLEELIAAGLPE